MRLGRFVPAVLLLLSSLAAVARDSDKGVLYRDANLGFEVAFPGKPKKESRTYTVKDRDMPTMIVYSGGGNAGASVVAIDFPKQVDIASHRRSITDLVVENIRSAAQATIQQDDGCEVAGAPGRHIVMRRNANQWAEGFVFTHGTKLFAVMVAAASRTGLKAPAYQRFFKSFKLL